jgi:hypothetical protein
VLDSVELVQVSEEAFAESAMANEISAGSRKRRRQLSISEPVADPTPVLDVVLPRRRRSSRSNKYQGFKPKVVGDNPKRKSHVKPMCAPAKKQPVSAKLKGKEVSDEADSSQAEDPTMKPTPIKFLQHVGGELCGIPAEEISEYQLLLPRKDGDASMV